MSSMFRSLANSITNLFTGAKNASAPTPVEISSQDEKATDSGDFSRGSTALWENIVSKYPVGTRTKGKVVKLTHYGVLVAIEKGVTGYIHREDLTWRKRVLLPHEILKFGQEVNVVILGLNNLKRQISLGFKQCYPNPLENLSEKYVVGTHVKGKIVKLDSYGAVVELERDVAGVVHVSNFSWGNNYINPGEIFQRGEVIETAILGVDEEMQRIDLGIKQLSPNFWEGVASRYPENSRVKGKVVKFIAAGVLVQLESGIVGIILPSELSWKKSVTNPEEVLKIGEEIETIVLSVCEERSRIYLSIKKLLPNPLEDITQKYIVNTQIKGKIVKFSAMGVIVELEPGVEGVIENSDFSWINRDSKPDEMFKIGEEIEVVILSISVKKCKIRLGIKQSQPVPNKDITYEYPVGSMVKGKIVKFTASNAIVDIEPGIKGIIKFSEISWINCGHNPTEILKIGEEIEGIVLSVNKKIKQIAISIKRLSPCPWPDIIAKYPIGSRVKGNVVALTDYGAFVEIEPGLQGFLHFSEFSWEDCDYKSAEMSKIGETIEVLILDINEKKQKIILSIKRLLFDIWEGVRSKYPVGSRVKGKIMKLSTSRACVEIEKGIEGFLNASEFSWSKRNVKLDNVLAIGEEIEVVILSIDEKIQQLSLSSKRCTPDPWENITCKYSVGTRIKGKVVKIVAYGAFIEIERGMEGLIHASELSWSRHSVIPSKILKVGEEIEAVILNLDEVNRKISLGFKQCTPNPWENIKHNYPVGTRVHRKVYNLTKFGAFVELEKGIDAMIHTSEMSWTRQITHPGEILKEGDEVDAVVLNVDAEQRRIALSIKQTQDDPWSGIDTKYRIGEIVEGKIARVTNLDAFVELENGIEGLVHISQISEERPKKIEEVLEIGQEISVRIIKIDYAARRIGLSVKAVGYDDERFKAEIEAVKTISSSDAQ